MKRKDFIDNIKRIENSLITDFERHNCTYGLCNYMAKYLNAGFFQHIMQPNRPQTAYWLGDISTVDGLNTRLIALHMYKENILTDKQYKVI